MRIDLYSPSIGSTPAEPTRSSAANSSRRTNEYSDSAALSSARDGVRAMSPEAFSEAEVRMDRVSELRSQIDAGTYSVNAASIANAMFNQMFR